MRGIGVLASGTVIGQLIQILATPILTRLYSPSEFGVLAVFVGLLGPITVVACLRFEMAIPLPKRDGAAYQVVGLAFCILLLITLITGVVGFWLGNNSLGKIGGDSLRRYYWLLPIAVFLGGLYQLSSMWAIRKKAFGVIAKTRVQQGLGAISTQAGLGLVKFGSLGLILGQVLGQAIGLVRLTDNLLRDYRSNSISVNMRGMRWALCRFKRFLKYDSLASLLNTAGAQVPAILFAALFSPAIAGAYLLSVRILSAPITLIGKTLVQALLPNVIEARYQDQLPVMVRRLQRMLTTVSLAPFFIFALLAPLVFGHIFGPKWGGAGNVAAWTALWVAFQFTYSPLSVVLLAIEAQKMNLILQSLSFFARLGALYICYKFGLEGDAVAAYSMVSAAFYMAATVAIELKVGMPFRNVIREALSGILSAIIITSPVIFGVAYDCRGSVLVGLVALALVGWLGQLWIVSRNDGTKQLVA